MGEAHEDTMNTKVRSNQRVTKFYQKHHVIFSYDFCFIDVKRGSYGEAKRRVAAVMFRVVDWIDQAGVIELGNLAISRSSFILVPTLL